MEFEEICGYRHGLSLNFVTVVVSLSIFIFPVGEIRYTLCDIPTRRYLVKISEGSNVLVGISVL